MVINDMSVEWQFLRKLLAAANAKTTTPLAQRSRWQVLAFDMRQEKRSDEDAMLEPSATQLSKFSRSEWRTIWSDGRDTRAFDGLLARVGGQLQRLETQVISKTKAHRCAEGNLCSRYRVDVLVGRSILGGRPRFLWRSPESRHLDFCKCAALPDAEVQKRKIDAEEASTFSIQSIVDDKISIDAVTDEYDIGRGTPHGGRVWQTLTMTHRSLRNCRAPRRLLAKADAAFAQLAKCDVIAQDYDPSYFESSGYLLIPHKGGVAVDFQCGYHLDPFDTTLYRLRLEDSDEFDQEPVRRKSAFVHRNQALFPWNEIDVFTVAPDGSSMLYSKDSQLFWYQPDGETIELGAVRNFRGWQWIDSSNQPATELQWLRQDIQAAKAC